MATTMRVVGLSFTSHAVPSVVGGHVTAVLLNLSDFVGFVKGGKLRAIVVTSPQRDESLPDVPTAREAGHSEV